MHIIRVKCILVSSMISQVGPEKPGRQTHSFSLLQVARKGPSSKKNIAATIRFSLTIIWSNGVIGVGGMCTMRRVCVCVCVCV